MDTKVYFPPTASVIFIRLNSILCLSDDTNTGGTGSDMPWG